MRVLFATSHLGAGGAQTSLVRLASELARRHRVWLYSLDVHPPYGHLERELREAGVKVVRLPYPVNRSLQLANGLLSLAGSRVLASEVAHRWRLRRLVASVRPDVVSSHLFNADRVASEVAREAGVPLVITDHGDYRDVVEDGVASTEEVERVLGSARAVVYLSDHHRQVLSRFSSWDDVVVRKILHGVASRDRIRERLARGRGREPGGGDGEFRFVMVGRGVTGKGWEEFVEAVERLAARAERPVKGVCVGEGDLLDRLAATTGGGGGSPVEFAGQRDEPMDLVEKCDVGVLPSRAESFGMAVAEYLVCGKPVIVTAVGGVAEMLAAEERPAGTLLSPGSEGAVRVGELVEAMSAYVERPELYEAHARGAEEVALRFSVEACAAAYEELFEDLR